jgi:ArsR family metal-binding transcriptional regulator
MNEQDNLVKLYTGGDVIINRIKLELEAQDINCLIKDRFKQGLAAGFVDGVPSAIDIFVTDEDFEKANEVVKALTEK